jgi:hypothetical protein
VGLLARATPGTGALPKFLRIGRRILLDGIDGFRFNTALQNNGLGFGA